MFPASPTVNISYQQIPLLDRSGYVLDGVENNPTLTVVRGHTYKLKVDAPEAYRIWIKTALGVASTNSYFVGISGNGSGEISWRVDETTPTRLVYQSWASPQIAGGILVSDNLPEIPTEITTVGDLRQALALLQTHLIYRPSDLAGPGLKMEAGALTLANDYPSYLKDSTGTIYSTQTLFDLNDDPSNLLTTPIDLQSWLNYIAASLKQLKGSSNYNTPATSTLTTLKNRLDNLALEISHLNTLV